MDNLEDIFAPGGLLDESLPDYVFRPSQLELATLADKAFCEKRNFIMEAGTGTGKSFAYLVPAILAIKKDAKTRVVVAASTNALSRQLFEKDIPFLSSLLSASFNVEILHGRGNYLCIRKLIEEEDKLSLLKDEDDEISTLSSWARKTSDGVLGDSHASLWLVDRVRSEQKSCMKLKCPYFEDCFYFKARKRMEKANLIVTNHHIFLIDAKHREELELDYSDNSILPAYDFAIIDEAHHLEREATDLLSYTFDPDEVVYEIDQLLRKDKNGSGLIEKLRDYANDKNQLVQLEKMLRDMKKTLSDAKELISVTFPWKNKEFLMTEELYGKYAPLLGKLNAIGKELVNLASLIVAAFFEDKLPEDKKGEYEMLELSSSFISQKGSNLILFSSFDDFDQMASYVRIGNKECAFIISPLLVGNRLSQLLYGKLPSIIFSSATLSLGGEFSHFKDAIGLSDDNLLEFSSPSPFDFEKNMMLLSPRDGMEYDSDHESEYNEYVADVVTKAIVASGGGALVLFTSWAMLDEVEEKVRKNLPDMMILKQKRGDSSALRTFKKEADSSLFATSTFWEGFDAPGNTLRLLIITKLPFSPPTSPMQKARAEYYRRRNENAFAKISMPEAAIKFRQGAGRLIRKEGDRGVVLVPDSRIVRKYYGRYFISSLPKCYFPEDTTMENFESKIENFLY